MLRKNQQFSPLYQKSNTTSLRVVEILHNVVARRSDRMDGQTDSLLCRGYRIYIYRSAELPALILDNKLLPPEHIYCKGDECYACSIEFPIRKPDVRIISLRDYALRSICLALVELINVVC